MKKPIEQKPIAPAKARDKHGREFSHTWFYDDIAPIWRQHILPMRAQIKSYLELGVSEAQSLLWVIENILPSGPDGGFAVGVDPYIPHRRFLAADSAAKRQRAIDNLTLTYGADDSDLRTGAEHTYFHATLPTCVMVYQASLEFMAKVPRAEILGYDFIYVDGDHQAHACLADMVFGWQHLHDGGIMVVDDLERRWFRGHPQVHEAVAAFRIGFEKRYRILFETINQIGFVKESW